MENVGRTLSLAPRLLARHDCGECWPWRCKRVSPSPFLFLRTPRCQRANLRAFSRSRRSNGNIGRNCTLIRGETSTRPSCVALGRRHMLGWRWMRSRPWPGAAPQRLGAGFTLCALKLPSASSATVRTLQCFWRSTGRSACNIFSISSWASVRRRATSLLRILQEPRTPTACEAFDALFRRATPCGVA